MGELKEMLDKHKKILEGNNWMLTIIVLVFIETNKTIKELDTILTKLENGTLTKEEFLKKEVNKNGIMD